MADVTVLLVEDNVINQRVAKHMLASLGYRVDVAQHGAEAITILEKCVYDLVLMDCQMLEMDGYTATKIIRDPASRVLNHTVPIIAITAFTTLYNREACFAVGMNAYIEKPVLKNVLKEVLEKFLNKTVLEEKQGILFPREHLNPRPQSLTIQLASGRIVEVESNHIKMVSPDSFNCHDWNIRQDFFLDNVKKAIRVNLGETAGPTIVCGMERHETGVLPPFLISCKLVSDPLVSTFCESMLLVGFFAEGDVFTQSLQQIFETNFKWISWERVAQDYDL